jgi:O-antigen ligase
MLLGMAYLFIAFVTVRDSAFVPRGQRRDIHLNLLLAIAFASVLWSSMPGRSLSRAVELLFTTWFAAYLGRRYSVEDQVLLLAYSLIVIELLSVAAALFLPDLGIMHGEFEGAWRGVFGHKNALGRVAFLGCLVFGVTARLPRHRALGWTGFIGSVMLLLLSTSRSALIGLITVAAMVPLFRSLKHRGAVFTLYMIAAITIPALLGLWTYTHLEEVLDLLGRNLTMSGRTTLWLTVASFVARRPFFGYGYNAFWQGMNGDSGFIALLLRWEVPHSHNGLLELALDTGLVGVFLFVVSYLFTVREAVRLQKAALHRTAMWPLLGLAFVAITNLTESALLRSNNTFWIVYLLLAFGTRSYSAEPEGEM